MGTVSSSQHGNATLTWTLMGLSGGRHPWPQKERGQEAGWTPGLLPHQLCALNGSPLPLGPAQDPHPGAVRGLGAPAAICVHNAWHGFSSVREAGTASCALNALLPPSAQSALTPPSEGAHHPGRRAAQSGDMARSAVHARTARGGCAPSGRSVRGCPPRCGGRVSRNALWKAV